MFFSVFGRKYHSKNRQGVCLHTRTGEPYKKKDPVLVALDLLALLTSRDLSHSTARAACTRIQLTVFTYMSYVWSHIHIARVWINRVRLPNLLVVSWTGKNNISLSAFAPENLVSRDGFGSPVPRQPAHLHTQAEPGSHLRDSSRVPRRRPFIYFKPPYAIGSVPSLSGHAIAYRWRSLPRVRRHRASKPQCSSERVLPWQVTMDQLICASLSHTNYWYEVGILRVRNTNNIS